MLYITSHTHNPLPSMTLSCQESSTCLWTAAVCERTDGPALFNSNKLDSQSKIFYLVLLVLLVIWLSCVHYTLDLCSIYIFVMLFFHALFFYLGMFSTHNIYCMSVYPERRLLHHILRFILFFPHYIFYMLYGCTDCKAPCSPLKQIFVYLHM